jgi:REP element-mobilizing transposase RayT
MASFLPMDHPDHLPRLSPAAYQGQAWVHWTMTLHDRAKGWLDDEMHGAIRELLLHTMARYHLHCAAYCLMPDHAHFLWMGLWEGSDQLKAARFFRRHWNAELGKHGVHLQPQAYDHVLRESERRPDAFEDTIIYVFQNPQRAGLIADWQDWPYSGALVPGYPDLPIHPLGEYWPRYWTIHNKERTRFSGEAES